MGKKIINEGMFIYTISGTTLKKWRKTNNEIHFKFLENVTLYYIQWWSLHCSYKNRWFLNSLLRSVEREKYLYIALEYYMRIKNDFFYICETLGASFINSISSVWNVNFYIMFENKKTTFEELKTWTTSRY